MSISKLLQVRCSFAENRYVCELGVSFAGKLLGLCRPVIQKIGRFKTSVIC